MKYLLIAAALALSVPAHAGEGSAVDFAFSAYVYAYAKVCPNPQVPKASYKWINKLVHSVSKNKQIETLAKRTKEARDDPSFCEGVGVTLNSNLQPDVALGD